MVELAATLEINGEEVVAQVIEGEAIIINLSNGMYYSLEGVGGEMWSLIAEGRTIEEVSDTIRRRHGVEEEIARQDVTRLARELVEENLVRVADGRRPSPSAPAEAGSPSPGAYAPPRLHAYRDMADLLALDPPMLGVQAAPWEAPEAPAPTSGYSD